MRLPKLTFLDSRRSVIKRRQGLPPSWSALVVRFRPRGVANTLPVLTQLGPSNLIHLRGVASIGAAPKEGIESMGRRLLLIFGMMLSALSTATVARGQTGDVTAKPSDSAPLLSPSAGDSSKRGDGTKADPDLKQAEAPVPAQTEAPAAPVPVGNPPAAGDGSPNAPPSETAAAEPESEKTAVDRLPLGKQSVAVTVDVQAPASMNLNKESTLKLIVRNIGTSDALNVRVQDELPEGLEAPIESAPGQAYAAAESLLDLANSTCYRLVLSD